MPAAPTASYVPCHPEGGHAALEAAVDAELTQCRFLMEVGPCSDLMPSRFRRSRHRYEGDDRKNGWRLAGQQVSPQFYRVAASGTGMPCHQSLEALAGRREGVACSNATTMTAPAFRCSHVVAPRSIKDSIAPPGKYPMRRSLCMIALVGLRITLTRPQECSSAREPGGQTVRHPNSLLTQSFSTAA